jgi:CRISPR-associated protein Csb1
MSAITIDLLTGAVMPGGASCLSSVTELEPAAGPHASVAPAKFASPTVNDKKGAYAYERRFHAGRARTVVLIDSKQSQLNRCEAALEQAITDGHPVLSRMPRVVVSYDRNGLAGEYSDLSLPHRVFDGHVRAGTVDGRPVTQLEAYRAIRADEPGILLGHLGGQLLQPGAQPLQVFDPLRQDAGVDEDLPDVVQALVLRQLIEEFVGNRAILSG